MCPKSQAVFRQELEILRRKTPSAKRSLNLASSCSLLLVSWPCKISRPAQALAHSPAHMQTGLHPFSQQMHWRDPITEKDSVKGRF